MHHLPLGRLTASLQSQSVMAWQAVLHVCPSWCSGAQHAVLLPQQVEDVCNPVVSAAYAAAGGAPGGEDDEDLGDHDEL